jgi:hypothetical protein
MAPAARIFVSHAHEDTAWCRAFVQALREAGADVWDDEHHLGDGVMGEEIERELQARPIFIVILSPASLASPGVQREVSAAMGLKDWPKTRSMLLVMAEQVHLPRLWADYPRVSGPGDRGLSATVAARRVISTLAIAPAHPPGASLVSARSEPGREVKAYRPGPHALHRVTRWVNIAALVVMTASILALLLHLLTGPPPVHFPCNCDVPFTPKSTPVGITTGPDGALWFAEPPWWQQVPWQSNGADRGRIARRSHTSTRHRVPMLAASVAEKGLAS